MAANLIYEDFEPAFDWANDEESETLILMLPGFRKEQLKVQITSNGFLKIYGERPLGGNKWRRFSKEFSIPPDCDSSDIGAKFTGGLLYVRLQKSITPAMPQETAEPPQEVPKPEAPSQESHDQQKPTQEVSSEPRKDKEEEKVEETPQKALEEEKKLGDGKEMEKVEAEASKEAQKKEKMTNGGFDEEAKAETSKVQDKYIGAVSGFGRSISSLLSRQTQDYKEALASLVGRIDMQKKVANFIVAILFVVVLGLYVKNAVKSFHGRSKIDEL